MSYINMCKLSKGNLKYFSKNWNKYIKDKCPRMVTNGLKLELT